MIISLLGLPNSGKSTLINRMLGEERVVVYDQPGTTRDSLYIPFERRGKKYTLIDTAGIKKRGKTKQVVEKFSVVKSLQAIRDSNVVVLLVSTPNSHLTAESSRCHVRIDKIELQRRLLLWYTVFQ